MKNTKKLAKNESTQIVSTEPKPEKSEVKSVSNAQAFAVRLMVGELRARVNDGSKVEHINSAADMLNEFLIEIGACDPEVGGR